MTPPTLETARVSRGSTEAVVVALPRERRRVAADLIALTKPRVVLMVLVTTVVGYYVGLTGAPDYARLVHLLIGTMLAAGGTLALNQYWERDVDARMDRTRVRPLPDGRLSPLWIPGEQITVTALPVAHRLVGSLILAATVILAVRVSVVEGPVRPARTEGGLRWARPGSAGRGSSLRGRRARLGGHWLAAGVTRTGPAGPGPRLEAACPDAGTPRG